jgi:glycosyltransferase involved in cell wall biosynthesis
MGGVALIIPVINEGETIAAVARDIPRDVVDVVIVVDGGSTDMTVAHIRQADSLVIVESQSGWGAELLAGIRSAPVDFLSPQKPRWRPMRPRIRLYCICLARRTWWAG